MTLLTKEWKYQRPRKFSGIFRSFFQLEKENKILEDSLKSKAAETTKTVDELQTKCLTLEKTLAVSKH